MGKRRRSTNKPKVSRRRDKVAIVFDCLFCNTKSSVTVRLNKKTGVGDISCSACAKSFQSPVSHLSEAVDVYSDWVDACHAVAERDTRAIYPLKPVSPKTVGKAVRNPPLRDARTGLVKKGDEDDEEEGEEEGEEEEEEEEEDEDPIVIFDRFEKLQSARSAGRRARADKTAAARSAGGSTVDRSSSQV